MYEQLEKQAFNRDQDAHGLYMYNDYTAYGINEVVDNWVGGMRRWARVSCRLFANMSQLKDFNKEISKTVSPYVVWVQLESISMFLQLDYIDIWFRELSYRLLFHHFILNISQREMTVMDSQKQLPLLAELS